MATHSSILAWKIQWSEEPGGLQSTGSQRVGHTEPLQEPSSITGGGGVVTKSCPTLATPWTVALQAPLSMGFSRQEYWSGLPFPSPANLPDPGIEPRSPALQAGDLLTEQ